MLRVLKGIWEDLGKSIYKGERYERNLRGITLVGLLLVVVNVITGAINLVNNYYSAAVTAPLFIAAGLLILFFSHFRQSRKGAVITAMIAVIVIFTYGAAAVPHGFTIFWTLLLPMAFSYFGSVKSGIGVSLYFLAFYWILFITPLRDTLGKHYSDIVAQRFPLLFLADVVLTLFIMVQYHLVTLRRMEADEDKDVAVSAERTKTDVIVSTEGTDTPAGTAGAVTSAQPQGTGISPLQGMKKKRRRTTLYNLIVPLVIILCLMITMVVYTSRVIKNVAVTNIHEVGEDRISSVAAQMENYLYTTESVLWVTADTVDHMIRNGSTTEQILQYITEETNNQEQQFDENYTGIYGVIKGEYLDGAGWEPPEGYDPTERDWYKMAVEAAGESVIVPPYVDAQTHSVIISICRLLSGGENVLSLDVMMNRIQEMIKGLQIKEKGYGFIVDQNGMIIAHSDDTLNGSYLTETDENRAFLQQIAEIKNGDFEMTLEEKDSTVFVRQIMDQWYIVIAVPNAELYSEIWQQLTVNVLICLIIFVLIAFFYLYGHRIEKNYSRSIEAMKMEEQRKEYETRVLKLEKEAADQANKAKSDFLAEMSHEIRTPINAVLGMNEMILRESGQGRRAAAADEKEAFDNISIYAGNIESAGNNLLSIINDILDFSKIEAGRMDIVPGKYQLSSVLNDVSNIAYYRAKEKELAYLVDVDETIPDWLYGDELRVRQVITNLLSNAVKYTDSGSIRLKLRCETEAREAGMPITLLISVTDTGIGIREEDVRKLFTKFQRVDLERNSTVEGTGLGLAITQKLLTMMGGEIRVESVYGEGSTFTVMLPQEIVSSEPVGNFQEKFENTTLRSQAYRETFRAPDAHILIVDDTRMNLTVATGLLKSTEIQMDTAGSGEEAIALARTIPYDLILMDQRMPKMDGTEALHYIREQEDGCNRQTPVICLTADAVIGAKEKYLAEGFDDYLTKPVDSAALEKMLVRYLPGEKMISVDKEETPAAGIAGENTGGADIYAPLRAAGIRPETGLDYCQGDEALYQSLLREYAQSAMEKAPDIQQSFEMQEWKNYSIFVHALKSSSKMIGAEALSETAARLEAAAGQAKETEIHHEHYRMMGQYDAVARVIRTAFPEEVPRGSAMDPAVNPDEEILEFLPVE